MNDEIHLAETATAHAVVAIIERYFLDCNACDRAMIAQELRMEILPAMVAYGKTSKLLARRRLIAAKPSNN